jgi:hypothetical protein
LKHQSTVGKSKDYFRSLLPVENEVQAESAIDKELLKASYQISYQIVKAGKSHRKHCLNSFEPENSKKNLKHFRYQQLQRKEGLSRGILREGFLLKPFPRFLCIMARCQIGLKDCFIIFVALLDEFDHFGQTFGDSNVSIDSLTLDSPYEGCRDNSFGGDRTAN